LHERPNRRLIARLRQTRTWFALEKGVCAIETDLLSVGDVVCDLASAPNITRV